MHAVLRHVINKVTLFTLPAVIVIGSGLFAPSHAQEELMPDSYGAVEVHPLHPPEGFKLPIATNSHLLAASDYPRESIARCETGSPRLRYLVLVDGSVGDVQVKATPPPTSVPLPPRKVE